MQRMRVLSVLAGLLLVFGLLGPAAARQWKPTAMEMAQDYLRIEHNISEREGVIIMWLAPQFFDPATMDASMEQVFEQYALISIIHFAMDDLGQFKSIEPTNVTLELSGADNLTPLPGTQVPPLVSSIIHFLETSLGGGLGVMGQGIKTFVYDGSQIQSCGEGKLWVRYLEERYEYEMPVPGCAVEQADGVEQSG